MKFTKMHGLGNDYLYIFSSQEPTHAEEIAKKYSDRRFGAGSDGIIYILPSQVADFKMRIFNADGSEGAMCGNGIRCLSKYVYDRGHTTKTDLDIETLSGIRHVHLMPEGGRVSQAVVNMGVAAVEETKEISVSSNYFFDKETLSFKEAQSSIPSDCQQQSSVCQQQNAEGQQQSAGCQQQNAAAQEQNAKSQQQNAELQQQIIPVIPVNVGNPHAVIFCKSADMAPVSEVGPAIEKNAAFPDGVNVEFVHVMSNTELRMRVWERGSGITSACGTGACASVAAAVEQGYCPRNENISVHLDGGVLYISVGPDNTVFMTGPATFVYDGETIEE